MGTYEDDHGPVSDPLRPMAQEVKADASEPTEDPADRWLIGLRWVAIFGMAATIFLASRWVPELDVRGMTALLLVLGAVNILWTAMLSDAVRRRVRRVRAREAAGRFVELQLTMDMVSVGCMLWLAGGLTNPFAMFLTFQIALAGLLTTPRATLALAGLGISIVFVVAFAPPLPTVSRAVFTAATVVSLSSLTVLLGAFAAVYAGRLNEQRRDNSRNERLAVLGRLVGAMSHELNTPLSTIKIISTDLHRFHREMSQDEIEGLSRQIVEESERAGEIVSLVRGHVGPDRLLERVELTAFVHEHARQELDRLAFKGRLTLGGADPIEVLTIPRALVQILVNVLRNATEANLLRRSNAIHVTVRRAGDHAEVSVEDRGPGFNPEILKRLGEPFQTTKEAEGGMGLGLYVSARLAAQLNGSLSVQTRRTGGARVVIRLPVETTGVLLGGTSATEGDPGPTGGG